MYHNYYQPVQNHMYRPYPCMTKRCMYQHHLMPYYIKNNHVQQQMQANQSLYNEQPPQPNFQAAQPVYSPQQMQGSPLPNQPINSQQQQGNNPTNTFPNQEVDNEAVFSHQFLNEQGQVDVNKMLSTVGHLAQTVQQVSPVIKQVNDIIQSFRV